MCQLVDVKIMDRKVHVAAIKQKYVQNIADAAQECDYIDRIILFGSSTREDCREDSDIDIAVFGNVAKGKCLTSKKYENFLKQIYSYDDFSQSYDVLYFKTGSTKKSLIMDNISNGEVLYARN